MKISYIYLIFINYIYIKLIISNKTMCYAVQCKKCGKTTWAGCGMHKNSVMEKVPENERCQCPREESYFPCEII